MAKIPHNFTIRDSIFLFMICFQAINNYINTEAMKSTLSELRVFSENVINVNKTLMSDIHTLKATHDSEILSMSNKHSSELSSLSANSVFNDPEVIKHIIGALLISALAVGVYSLVIKPLTLAVTSYMFNNVSHTNVNTTNLPSIDILPDRPVISNAGSNISYDITTNAGTLASPVAPTVTALDLSFNDLFNY